MTDLRDHNELKRLLDAQPRHLRIALAARAALRVLPVIGLAIPRSDKIDERLEAEFLSVFRGIATAWIASGPYVGPDRLAFAARSPRLNMEPLRDSGDVVDRHVSLRPFLRR